MDFKTICRICLESSKQTYDIYTSYYLKRNILYCEMLSNCTKLKPVEEDGLPRLICKECCRQLKRSYAFNIQCTESEQTLRHYLEHTVIPKTEACVTHTVSVEVKSEDYGVDQLELMLKENKVFDDGVKSEPVNINGTDDSCWDADDDNMALGDIKLKKTLKESNHNSNEKDDKLWESRTDFDDLLYEDRSPKKSVKECALAEAPLPDSKMPSQCDVCGKIISTKSNLKAHKICHTDSRPYKCAECPASFKGHSALFQHKRVHSGETPYHCEYCPKQFSRRAGLVNHIRVHTGEKLFSCTICFKDFVQKTQLSIHMKRHKGDKTFLCQVCGKGFPIKSDLRVHQRTHNGEKPYSCHLCEKTFATSGNLSIHIRIHNKEVRYNCKECQRGFVTCSSYNVHLKRHKGQRDYQCECGKTFYTSSALKQHKVVHTGVKKYQCTVCERKFSQTSHLSRHFRKEHAKPGAPLPAAQHYRRVLPDEQHYRRVLPDEQHYRRVLPDEQHYRRVLPDERAAGVFGRAARVKCEAD
ncbi:zinc finger protein 436-like isoform X2 [Pararge aegeria]|uniref:zinc finger protein 436-like isoform X2 n=1 Tax=Pararge aegeria TaxID=116150 RepID=UPI0019D00334|nr:zinc finger protein 436-like isoform X2 [Pararge aegeria]